MTYRGDYNLPKAPTAEELSQESILKKYLDDLVFAIQDMNEKSIDEINGEYRTDYAENSRKWEPKIIDSADSTITFTYVYQVGWVYRKGLNVDCWFDIEWEDPSGALAGNMILELPYRVANTTQEPFVGVLQPSSIAFTVGTSCVINAQSDSFNGYIYNVGSGIPSSRQNSVATGKMAGYLRYVGQQNK